MIPNRFKTIYEVTRKELFEHFKTLRLLVITIIFVSVFFIVMGVGHYLVGGDEPVYMRGANEALGVLLAFSSLFPPILAIVLSYDLIVGERIRRSLHLVLSKPVDRSSIYIGKFLGAFISISLVYLIVCSVGYIVAILFSGKIPSAMEVGRAYGAIAIILFSTACWILFIMLFSTSFKTTTTTIVFSVLFWLFILNLLSNSGLIYYSISQETVDETITIDLLVSSSDLDSEFGTTSILFWAHTYDIPVLGVDYEVRHINGTIVDPERSSSLYSFFITYTLSPGYYSWNASYKKDLNSQDKNIATGKFVIAKEFVPMISVLSLEDDKLYNDALITMGIENNESTEGFDLEVAYISNKTVVERRINYTGPYFVSDLAQGDYLVTIHRNNIIYMESEIHSYGTGESDQDLFVTNEDEEFEYPGYVKIPYASNPDNAGTVAYEVLLDGDGFGVLSIGEGLMALTIEFFILLFFGLLIFSRIELL